MNKIGQCAVCFVDCEKKCSKCQRSYYCGAEHQKDHWKMHKKDCFPIEVFEAVGEDKGRGRGVRATKNLEPFDIICKEHSIINLPTGTPHNAGQFSMTTCVSCLIRMDHGGGKPCSRCAWPVCDSRCELKPAHANFECEIFSTNKIKPDVVGAEVLVQVLRCLLLKVNDPSKYEVLMNLKSHIKERMDDNRMLVMTFSVLKNLKDCTLQKSFTHEEIVTVIGIVNTNALSEQTDSRKMRRNSCHLYEKACLINHSCRPNTRTVIDSDGKLNLIATMKIAVGEELTIPYASPMRGTIQRQKLCGNYYFKCICQRCLDPTELGTHFSSLKCTKCPEGYVLWSGTVHGDGDSEWKCNSCATTIPTPVVTKMLQCIEDEIDQVIGSDEYTLHTVRRYDEITKKYSGTILHPNHYLMFDLEYDLIGFLYHFERNIALRGPHPNKIMLKKRIVTLGRKLLGILDIISPGPRLIRGRILYFLSTGLLTDKINTHCANRMMMSGKIKKSGKDQTIDEFKSICTEALQILSLEPKHTDDQEIIVPELAQRLQMLSD